jgi:hypothetical protein
MRAGAKNAASIRLPSVTYTPLQLGIGRNERNLLAAGCGGLLLPQVATAQTKINKKRGKNTVTGGKWPRLVPQQRQPAPPPIVAVPTPCTIC